MFAMNTKLLTAVAIGLLASSWAQAHVTLAPREARTGAPYRAVLGVTHGCEDAPTIRLRVQIPEGVIGVKPMPKPGWQVETRRAPYEKSYTFFHGQQLAEGVKEITWTGKLDDQFYDEFAFTSYLTEGLASDTTLYFPVVQECEGGKLHRWIEIPAADKDAASYKEPAPGVKLLRKPID